ncbi:hypothetical protein GCM10009097_10690 [Pigmentiphaga daeguensis]|uniref:Prepilin-type N-terminal cleavage/methylation domain-containing protein n=1 Tax=Pigmentiphaga daeguensis TaxID=414049 RepID=A0ABN1BF72_9BURK
MFIPGAPAPSGGVKQANLMPRRISTRVFLLPPRGAAPEDGMKSLQKGLTLMQMLVLIGAVGVVIAVAVSYLR